MLATPGELVWTNGVGYDAEMLAAVFALDNHHAFAGFACLGLDAGELDPGWWMLLMLRKVGLVWGIRLTCDQSVRPEHRAFDSAALSSPALHASSFADAWRLLRGARRAVIRSEGQVAALSAILEHWVDELGLDRAGYGTHSMCRTKATQIWPTGIGTPIAVQRTLSLSQVDFADRRVHHFGSESVPVPAMGSRIHREGKLTWGPALRGSMPVAPRWQ